jgi:hypothetical protein
MAGMEGRALQGAALLQRPSVGSGLKELITSRESRARMIAPLPMALAGLAGFPVPRAARLRRVASFGLLWRRLCGLRLCACGFSRPSARPLDVFVWQQPFWLRRGVCGLLRLSRQQLDALQRSVCGSLRLSFLRSSAWGSSRPPFRRLPENA